LFFAMSRIGRMATEALEVYYAGFEQSRASDE
jgi:hypothetical protein